MSPAGRILGVGGRCSGPATRTRCGPSTVGGVDLWKEVWTCRGLEVGREAQGIGGSTAGRAAPQPVSELGPPEVQLVASSEGVGHLLLAWFSALLPGPW